MIWQRDKAVSSAVWEKEGSEVRKMAVLCVSVDLSVSVLCINFGIYISFLFVHRNKAEKRTTKDGNELSASGCVCAQRRQLRPRVHSAF